MLTSSCQPISVARAFRDRFGLTELYLADLDAIGGAAPALAVYTALQELGCRLWVDAGIRDAAAAEPLAAAGVERLLVGLETVHGPDVVEHLCMTWGGNRIVFSLDLKESRPLGDLTAWERPDAWSIARQAVAAGVRSLIVLDLARVGVGRGIGTEELCSRLANVYPVVQIVAGGGVRDISDLHRLEQCGVRAALVAS